eukprot:TRINITY_DN1531_c0_g1_i35.p3 TRINITY_DN1531_c0_g1~~TRINITY_DN1531_c0_g1_i35.p3  ORF type:complete len:205 (-),score=32.13 TRINITY_DN1531_c0_g1_i35:727-1341(-)
MVVPAALRVVRLRPDRKYTRLGRLSTEMGWKYEGVIARLEAKRKVFGVAHHERVKAAAKLRGKAAASAEFGGGGDDAEGGGVLRWRRARRGWGGFCGWAWRPRACVVRLQCCALGWLPPWRAADGGVAVGGLRSAVVCALALATARTRARLRGQPTSMVGGRLWQCGSPWPAECREAGVWRSVGVRQWRAAARQRCTTTAGWCL